MEISVELAVAIAFLILFILPWLFTDEEVKDELLDFMLRKEVRDDGNSTKEQGESE